MRPSIPRHFAVLCFVLLLSSSALSAQSAFATNTPLPPVAPVASATSAPISVAPADLPLPPPPTCGETQGRIVQADYASAILDTRLRYRVYLPPCYDAHSASAYPFIVLLHGSNRTDEHWQALGIQPILDTGILAGRYAPVVVLMPFGTWIANENWFEGTRTWSNILLTEFLPHAESAYRLSQARQHRAIGGISRGGFWAYNIALRFPDLFGSVGGHSAFFDEGQFPREYNPLWLAQTAPALENLRLWLDRGGQDYAAFGLDLLHQRLEARGIAHDYRVQPNGAHEDAYWSAQLADYLHWYDAAWHAPSAQALQTLPSEYQRLDSPDGAPALYLAQNGAQVPLDAPPERTTRLLFSGVTALGRDTREALNRVGVAYAGEGLQAFTQRFDFFHLSNETAFDPLCPRASQPVLGGLCSQPEHFALFGLLGADIIELTGNHNNDWGYDANAQTIDWLREQGFQTLGGGLNQSEARQPLSLNHNGNRIALVACNWAGPTYAYATDALAGAAECREDWLRPLMAELRASHDVLIVLIQHVEIERQRPARRQEEQMQAVAEWGADAVLGSQAHQPQDFIFVARQDRPDQSAFLHFGLGNLFFDQTSYPKNQFFLDELVISEGKLVQVVLHTGIIEGQARPRLHTPAEQADFWRDFSRPR